MREPDTEYGLESLHPVREVIEVGPEAANALLEAGWLLHDIYISQEYVSRYILLRLDESICPDCGGPARVESVDHGTRVRFVCQNECFFSSAPGTDVSSP
jgi:hypothetical protein